MVEGQNFGDELLLAAENQEYVIGRSPKADLVLEDREVSREHIKIVRRGFSVFIYDAASTRGSWLGRSAVYQGSRVEWQRPRMLKLGATVLSLAAKLAVDVKAVSDEWNGFAVLHTAAARVGGLDDDRRFGGARPLHP